VSFFVSSFWKSGQSVALKLGLGVVACLPGLISMVVVMGMWSVQGGRSSGIV